MVLPAPLRARRTPDDLTEWMDEAATPDGVVRVGLAHGSVAGRLPLGAVVSNPIAADRAQRAGLAYLALGDWHGLQQIGPCTWYSGTPEPDDFPANAQPGHALLVELDGADAPARVVPLPTATYSWAVLEIDCTGLEAGAAARHLAERSRAVGERQQALLRLRLRGSLGLALRAEVDEAVARLADEVHHLTVDDSGLIDAPNAGDVAILDTEPVIGAATARLRQLGETSVEPERAAAALALRLLYGSVREVC